MIEDIVHLSAHELLNRYRTGELSPVDSVKAILRRIDLVNPAINALFYVDEDRSLDRAAESEARWRRGEPIGPLDGVPVTLKDHISTRGSLSFFGSNAVNPEKIHDTDDAPVAARLKEAGAIILGKTTMPDFGMIASGISSRHGVTRNPWDLSRNSGGSSAGAGAAVATGIAPLAIGTDGGGSIRIPAAFCGVFGLKPSFGRVPQHFPAQWVVCGPITRSVADAALVMNVISRPDARDFSALPYDGCDYRDGLRDGVRGARVGILENIGFGLSVDPSVSEKLLEAGKVFKFLGANVEQVGPLFSESPEPDFDRLLHIRSYQLFSTMSRRQQDAMLPVITEWCRQANAETKQQLMQSLINCGPIRARTLAPFEKYEFLLMPVIAVPPYAAELPWPPHGSAHNPFCFPFNMSEQPAASIHGGFSQDGLPIGLQVVGRRFDDRGVLRAAYAYEEETKFLQRYAEPLVSRV